jgi:uncharacterized membrane protein YeaQ/YmgE (transglycosylase-associated protein family)
MGIAAVAAIRRVLPGERPGGRLSDLIIGVMSALAAGWLFQTFLGPLIGGWTGSMLVSFVTAFVALFVERVISGKRTV